MQRELLYLLTCIDFFFLEKDKIIPFLNRWKREIFHQARICFPMCQPKKEEIRVKDLFLSYRNIGKPSRCLFSSLVMGYCKCIITFYYFVLLINLELCRQNYLHKKLLNWWKPCFQMDFGSNVVFKWCKITGSTIHFFCKFFIFGKIKRYFWEGSKASMRRWGLLMILKWPLNP